MFQFVPVAEASVQTLMKSIDKVIINPIILFLFACAVAYFLYGVVQYFLSPDSEEIRKKSKSHMLWGVVGLFIMVAVFGIMNLILNTFGENKIKVNNNGDYVIEKVKVDGNGDLAAGSDSGPLLDKNVADSLHTGADIFTPIPISDMPVIGNSEDQPTLTPTTEQLPAATYTTNPFTKVYVEAPSLCWHKDVYDQGVTEYKALQRVKLDARTFYETENGIGKDEHKDYPLIYDRVSMYDPSGKIYHIWWDVRAPIGTGTVKDCNLKEILPVGVLPDLVDESTKPNPLVHSYASDATYYRAVGSGVGIDVNTARTRAINNALIKIARQKGLTSTDTLWHGGKILEEQYYLQNPPGQGNYDYWIAVQYKR